LGIGTKFYGGSLVRSDEGLMKYEGGENIVLKEMEAHELNVFDL
jgi:hypothetical protein